MWLWDNKEWLFSGAGIALVGLFITFVSRKFFKKPAPTTKPAETRKEKKASWLIEGKRISVGDYHDFRFDGLPLKTTVRVTVKEIKKVTRASEKEIVGAVLKVYSGGSLVICGESPHVGKEGVQLGHDEFWLPEQKEFTDSRTSIYGFRSNQSYFFFFGVSLAHINPHSGYVEINVVCVYGFDFPRQL
jgi:hypothetical protein